MFKIDSAPWLVDETVCVTYVGKRSTMPMKMISETPLPMPLSLICSPSHIKKSVPPVNVITEVKRKNKPGSVTAPGKPSMPTAMP